MSIFELTRADYKTKSQMSQQIEILKSESSQKTVRAIGFRSMGVNKPVMERIAKTVLNLDNKAFQEKQLGDGIVLNCGDLCVYSCSFCYASEISRKLVHELLKAFNKQNNAKLGLQDVVVRRANAADLAKTQIVRHGISQFNDPCDNRVVFSSSLVDVAANMQLLRETAELVNLILDETFWQIRLLTKSNLLHLLIKNGMVPNKKKVGSRFTHHERIIFGFSTGTLDDRLAKSFEEGTALVSKRLAALHWLQDRGFRTFGMICPSLPQQNYDAFSKTMSQALRVEKLEHVWAEVINVRGPSFQRTEKALVTGGFQTEANLLKSVSDGSKQAQQHWESYARATFEAHKMNIPPEKLRFLQYINEESSNYWVPERIHGAVLLGSVAKALGVCTLGVKSSPVRYYASPRPQQT
jgi:DNA repair photolyase